MSVQDTLDHINDYNKVCPDCGGHDLRPRATTVGIAVECGACGCISSKHGLVSSPASRAPTRPFRGVSDYAGSCSCEDYPCCGH